jgi:hypothetical protein
MVNGYRERNLSNQTADSASGSFRISKTFGRLVRFRREHNWIPPADLFPRRRQQCRPELVRFLLKAGVDNDWVAIIYDFIGDYVSSVTP